MSMNKIDTHNEEVLQSKREDFDLFLAKEDWKGAQAVIDSIREDGHELSADILRKALLKAQYESKDWDNEGKLNEEQREDSRSEWVEQQGGSYLED